MTIKESKSEVRCHIENNTTRLYIEIYNKK